MKVNVIGVDLVFFCLSSFFLLCIFETKHPFIRKVMVYLRYLRGDVALERKRGEMLCECVCVCL